jgi:hypothetical protein
MKHYGVPPRLRPGFLLALLALIAAAQTFANTIIAGGQVPALHSVSIQPTYGDGRPGADGAVEVAILEIDNNLPDFGLVLDFNDGFGDAGRISQVRIEGLEGMLGLGIEAPVRQVIEPDPQPGRFVWNPGPQRTATLGYRIRVLVTFGSPPTRQPLIRVAMPAIL